MKGRDLGHVRLYLTHGGNNNATYLLSRTQTASFLLYAACIIINRQMFKQMVGRHKQYVVFFPVSTTDAIGVDGLFAKEGISLFDFLYLALALC